MFLGTAGDSFVVGRQLRHSGGIIINVGDNQFHIDPGPGSLAFARQCGVNIRANTAVFVSHAHLIHSNDLNAVIDAMTYRGFDKKGVVVANKTVINGADDYEPRLLNFYKGCLERFIILEEGQRVGINEIEVQALKCRHSDPNTIGFKFFTPKFTLVYTADTSYSLDLVEQYKGANILILNVTNPNKKDSTDHLSCEDAIKIIKEVKPRLAVITHFGIKMLEADPIYTVREIQKETGIQTIAAKDGMIINPLSYAIDKGQRTLFAYPKKKQVEITEIKQEEAEKKQVGEPEPQEIPKVEVVPMEPREEPAQEALAEKQAQEQVEEPEELEEEPESAFESKKTLKDIFLQESNKETDQ